MLSKNCLPPLSPQQVETAGAILRVYKRRNPRADELKECRLHERGGEIDERRTAAVALGDARLRVGRLTAADCALAARVCGEQLDDGEKRECDGIVEKVENGRPNVEYKQEHVVRGGQQKRRAHVHSPIAERIASSKHVERSRHHFGPIIFPRRSASSNSTIYSRARAPLMPMIEGKCRCARQIEGADSGDGGSSSGGVGARLRSRVN